MENETIERPGKHKECRTCKYLWNCGVTANKKCGLCDNWTRNKWEPDCPDGTILVIEEQDER